MSRARMQLANWFLKSKSKNYGVNWPSFIKLKKPATKHIIYRLLANRYSTSRLMKRVNWTDRYAPINVNHPKKIQLIMLIAGISDISSKKLSGVIILILKKRGLTCFSIIRNNQQIQWEIRPNNKIVITILKLKNFWYLLKINLENR